MEPFVKGNKKDRFKNLTYENKRGAPPRIRLLDSDDNVVEELNVESWDTDAVEEFLAQRLIGEGSDAAIE
eukprot:m.44533 g.44533  ORF g.44533 m.44533 type:complete len:70 (-) comp10111_c0_seq1:1477-1686(-)